MEGGFRAVGFQGEEILKTVEEALAASLQAEKESRELEQQVLARKTGLERRLEAARAGEKLRQQQIRAEGLLQALEAERGLQEERKRRLKQAVEALPLQAKEEEILANRSALAQSRKARSVCLASCSPHRKTGRG